MIIYEPKSDYPDLVFSRHDPVYNYSTGELVGVYYGADYECGCIGIVNMAGKYREFLFDGFSKIYATYTNDYSEYFTKNYKKYKKLISNKPIRITNIKL